MNNNSNIGRHLKGLREREQLSTTDVQRLSGNKISQSFLVQIEKGGKTPSVPKLAALADVYGTSVYELVDVILGMKRTNKPEPMMKFSNDEMRLIKQVRKLSAKKREALLSFLI